LAFLKAKLVENLSMHRVEVDEHIYRELDLQLRNKTASLYKLSNREVQAMRN